MQTCKQIGTIKEITKITIDIAIDISDKITLKWQEN